MTTNLRPADRLLELRNRIKELQAEEKEIRDGIISGEISVIGDFATITVSKKHSRTFDRAAAEKELGPLDRFYRSSSFYMVKASSNVAEPEE